jgi:hypothetical protein
MRRALVVWVAAVCCFLVSVPGVCAKDFVYVPVNNALHVIDCETDTIIETIPYNDYIVTAAYSPDGSRYYLNAFHSVYAIDTRANELIDTYNFSTELSKTDVFGIAVSQDGKRLYLSTWIVKKKSNVPKLNVLGPHLAVFDIEKEKIVKAYPIPSWATCVLTLRNDPDHIILIGLNIQKLNLKTGKLEKLAGMLHPDRDDEYKNALAVWNNTSPGDNGFFVTPYYTADSLGYFIIDRNTGELSRLIGEDLFFEYATIMSPDQKYIYAVMDELIKIDRQTGKTLKVTPIEMGTCYTLSITSDGRKIYVGPAGADMSVYDTETLDLLSVIPLEGDGVLAHRISH